MSSRKEPLNRLDLFRSCFPQNFQTDTSPNIFRLLPHRAQPHIPLASGNRLAFSRHGLQLTLDRLRRERGQVTGELSCQRVQPNGATTETSIPITDFALTNARSLRDVAAMLTECHTPAISRGDWMAMLGEFTHHVLTSERRGTDAVDLATYVSEPVESRSWDVAGLNLLQQHPVLIFGDGGSGKSYFVLWIVGQLAHMGVRVGWFDWEMSADDHADRLTRLFPAGRPSIQYVRCDQPLIGEVDRLQRIIHEHGLEFVVFDSVAYAIDGHPDSSEVAMTYFRSLRQLGSIGSLHIAHITKNGDKNKPIGSTFWHNSARATWSLERSADVLTVTPRKANLNSRGTPLSFRQSFGADVTTFTPSNAPTARSTKSGALDKVLAHLQEHGPSTIAAIADAIGTKVDTIDKAVRRDKEQTVTRNEGLDRKAILSLIGQQGNPL